MKFIDAFEQADKEMMDLHVTHESLVNDYLCDLSPKQWETLKDILSDFGMMRHTENPKGCNMSNDEREAYKNRLFGVVWDASGNYAADIDKRMTDNGYYDKKWEKAS